MAQRLPSSSDARQRRRGPPLEVLRTGAPDEHQLELGLWRRCLIAGCERPEEAAGLCAGHRYRKRRGIPLDETPLRERLTPRERVLEAAKALLDADAEDRRAYHAAWSRLRAAARDWLDAGRSGRRSRGR